MVSEWDCEDTEGEVDEELEEDAEEENPENGDSEEEVEEESGFEDCDLPDADSDFDCGFRAHSSCDSGNIRASIPETFELPFRHTRAVSGGVFWRVWLGAIGVKIDAE